MVMTLNIDPDVEAKYLKEAFPVTNIYDNDEAFRLASENADALEYQLSIKYYPQWKDQAEKKIQAENSAELFKIGLPLLDTHLKIYGKRLVMIIGRSEMGKTSFAAQMIRKQLMDDKRVLVFSCEEAGEDFITRLNLTPELDEKMVCNFIMSDKGNITLRDIKLSCLKLDILGIGPDIVYVDQLNKIKPESEFRGSKHEKIVHVSEQLQNLVKIINRPLIILHQANRKTEENDSFMTQANVSDADAVFNESQIALFLESPDYKEWSKTKNPYRDIFTYYINVGKNRSVGGWKGAELCYFDRSKGIFLSQNEYESQQTVKDYEQRKQYGKDIPIRSYEKDTFDSLP